MTWSIVSSFRTKGLVAAAVLVLAGRAEAQPKRAGPNATSDAFDRACIDLIHGKTPKGEQAIEALRDACAALMKGRSEESRRAAQQRTAQAELRAQAPAREQGDAQASQSTAQPEAGQSILAAFGQAGNELVGSRARGMMGMSRSGAPFGYTLTTNPVGWFTGIGVNAELMHSFMPMFSWTGGAHYSQTNATDRSLYTLGVLGGVDWFLLGRNNEGLRFGPRLDVSFGREQSTGSSTRARLGLAGELGYNFIATNGLTGAAAFGLGGRVAGDKNEELSSGAGGEFGPYVKINFGYSW
jgi:hypothetical protein